MNMPCVRGLCVIVESEAVKALSLNTPRSSHETGLCHVRSAEVVMDDITVRLHDRVDEARKANLWDHELLYSELHRQIDALLVEWERCEAGALMTPSP